MPSLHHPNQNRLLAVLPDEDYRHLIPQLELMPLPLGLVLQEPGALIRYAYFPTTAIISLLHVMQSGASSEVATVGREGLIGTALYLGNDTAPNRAIVQSAGHGYRLPGQTLREEFQNNGPWQALLLRYTQSLLTQTAQTAVCNRHHSLDQQFCRWLLHCLDRQNSNDLVLTQELIANLLGVRREGISEAASNAQKAGLIKYQRGKVTVLDRAGLEVKACECYKVIRMAME
ncbi:MAG TPA: Crp/Fnr family transcriptional regulator [Rhodocyclaceae bacterium]